MGMKTIQLTNGGEAFVDDEDYSLLSRHKWRKMKNNNVWYVVAPFTSNSKITMHKIVMGSKAGYIVDHIDRNGLNNQKSNLRFSTASHNAMNSRKHPNCSSKFKGVYWCPSHGTWMSYIVANKKKHYVGSFKSELEAARAWNNAAKKFHGQFAYLNTLPDKEEK